MTRFIIRLAALLALSFPATLQANPIHHVVSSTQTANPDDGYGPTASSIPVELDATPDHMTGFVDIHRLQAIQQNGTVVIDIPPHSAQLALSSNNMDYAGDTPYGRINFWPRGTNGQYPTGWLFAFYPQPGVPAALLIQTPEPASGALLAVACLGLLVARRNQRRTCPA